jgi:hypothetical protein
MEDLAITFAQLTIRRPPDRPKGTFSRFELLNEDVIRIIIANFVPRGTLRARDQRYLTSNIFPDITATSVRELRKCLHALCLTSKHFYAIAHQLLYRVLIVKTQYEMALVFRTFTATTRLRSLVKTFAWVPDRFTPPTLQDEIESFSEENKMFAIQRDVGLHWPVSPADKECARQLPQGCQLPWSSEAVFTAVLGMLTHIKILCVVSGWREFPDAAPGIIGPDWVASSLQNLLGNDRGATFGFLQKLEVFSMDNKRDFNSGDRGSFYLATQLVLRACPKLRRVEYMASMDEIKNDYRFSSQGLNFLLGPHHPLSNSVEEVVVAFGTSPMAELPRILRVLPNLKVLRGEYCVITADTDSTQQRATSVQKTNTAGSWNDTRLALLEVEDTLHELHLTTRRERAGAAGTAFTEVVHGHRLMHPGSV